MTGDSRNIERTEDGEPVEQDAAKSSEAPAEGSDDLPAALPGSPEG